MKNIQTDKIKDGDYLAAPIIGKEGENILPVNTMLKKEYISLLQDLGIEQVCIFGDDDKKSSYLYFVLELKDIVESYIHNTKDHLIELKSLAHELYTEMVDCSLPDLKKEYMMDLYHHTIMTTILSLQLAKKVELSKEERENLVLAGLLHDIGLRYVTAPYMNHDIYTLTPNEIFEYKKHTIYGYSALEKVKWMSMDVKTLILSHHERIDGSGFPLKQKSDDMRQKILQLADAYVSNLTGMGCQRITKEESMKNIEEKAGVWYDGALVKILEQVINA